MAALVAAFFLSAPVAPVAPAAAQQPACPPRAPHEIIASCLERVFGEQPLWRGLDHGGRLLELFASVRGDTWTLIVTTPDGLGHMVRAGDAGYALLRQPGEQL